MNPDGAVSDAVRCLICLNTFSGQLVANPQHCEHHYCFACIQEWAKIKNSCPVDRLEFNVLYQRSCVGGDVQKIVKVERCESWGIEDEDRELSVCEGCGRSDRRHLMLFCSACDSRFHISCLRSPLDAVPFEAWFCVECVTSNENLSGEAGEIDEAEVTDLLLEAVLTSTRLRASTTQCPVPVSTRRSQRVRHQIITQTNLSQAAQHVPKYLLKSRNEDAKTSDLIPDTHKSSKQAVYKRKRRRGLMKTSH